MAIAFVCSVRHIDFIIDSSSILIKSCRRLSKKTFFSAGKKQQQNTFFEEPKHSSRHQRLFRLPDTDTLKVTQLFPSVLHRKLHGRVIMTPRKHRGNHAACLLSCESCLWSKSEGPGCQIIAGAKVILGGTECVNETQTQHRLNKESRKSDGPHQAWTAPHTCCSYYSHFYPWSSKLTGWAAGAFVCSTYLSADSLFNLNTYNVQSTNARLMLYRYKTSTPTEYTEAMRRH